MPVIGLLVVVLAGFFVVNLLAPKFSLPEKFAAGYGIGLVFATFSMFLLSWAGLPLSRVTVLLPSIAAIALCVASRKRVRRALNISRSPKNPVRYSNLLSPANLGLLSGLLLLVGISLVQAIYWPIRGFDSVHLYDNMARLVYQQKSIVLDDYSRNLFEIYVNYPLHVSLSHSLVYILAGSSQVNPKFIYVLYYLSLLIIFYCRCRCRMGDMRSLLATLLLASVPNIFSYVPWCSTNFPYNVYYAVGIIYLCESLWTGDRGVFVLGSLLLAFMSWIRPATEIILVGVFLVVAVKALRKRSWFLPAAIVFAAALIYIPWIAYLKTEGMSGIAPGRSLENMKDIFHWGRLLFVLKGCIMGTMFMQPSESGIVWYLFAFSVLYGLIRGSRRWELFWFIVAALIALAAAIYLVGVWKGFSSYWDVHARGQAGRMTPMLIPLAVYFIALMLFEKNNSKRE